MQLFENISLAVSGLRANKMRALLTMLGIIIGIGSVIAIVMVGDSMTSFMMSSLQDMGANNIQLQVQQRYSEYGQSYSVSLTDADMISDEMIEALKVRFADDVETVSISDSLGTGKAEEGRNYANIMISGVNDGYQTANHIKMVAGRFINEKDVDGVKNVAVVSDKFVNNMFGGNIASALGQEVKARSGENNYTFTIVGVYKYEQNAMMSMMGATAADKDIRTELYIPISTCQKYADSLEGYYYITVLTKVGSDSRVLAGKIEEYMNKFYVRNSNFQLSAMSLDYIIDQYSSMMSTMTVAISVIAAISLLVGGIGVMNIMLVSVTERTREIGTRKALGAKNSSIRIQFIVESVIICLIGGLIGIGVGIGLGFLGATLLKFPAHPSFGAIAVAVGFSMMIGVFFGYYPANKAAKLDPIEALRYE